jgi:hypothetical protein
MRRFCFDRRGKKGFFWPEYGHNSKAGANVMFEVNLNCRTTFQ